MAFSALYILELHAASVLLYGIPILCTEKTRKNKPRFGVKYLIFCINDFRMAQLSSKGSTFQLIIILAYCYTAVVCHADMIPKVTAEQSI